MAGKDQRGVKLWTVAVLAVLLCTIGTGLFWKTFAKDSDIYKGLKLFSEVIEIVEKEYVDEVDREDLIKKAIQGMINSLDPHSQLLPPEAYEELQIDTEGEFGGIGIVITIQNSLLTVIAPIEGTPAYEAGIQAGDVIVKVNGEPTKNMMLWEAVKKMRGPKGEPVIITIMRDEKAKPMDIKLIRDIIPIESVKYLTLEQGYGYVRITNFQNNTSDDLVAALKDLESKKEHVQGLILDLRDNPGGLLDQAVKVSDVFLENGLIVTIKGRNERNIDVYRATSNRSGHDYPIVVLINGGSASAAEIVAGALQDHKRAVILGTTSFGKGSVQKVETLRDGYGLKFTIARYYTPNGRSIQAKGIEPDIKVVRQVVEERENTDDGLIKESDLKNHLEAEPEKDRKSDKDDTSDEDKEQGKIKKRDADYRYGPLVIERLRSDLQIMRSLELLKSYRLFKGMQG